MLSNDKTVTETRTPPTPPNRYNIEPANVKTLIIPSNRAIIGYVLELSTKYQNVLLDIKTYCCMLYGSREHTVHGSTKFIDKASQHQHGAQHLHPWTIQEPQRDA